MKEFTDVTNVAVVGSIIIIGGILYKKLKNIHEEIIYFEQYKGVYLSKREHEKYQEKRRKKES